MCGSGQSKPKQDTYQKKSEFLKSRFKEESPLKEGLKSTTSQLHKDTKQKEKSKVEEEVQDLEIEDELTIQKSMDDGESGESEGFGHLNLTGRDPFKESDGNLIVTRKTDPLVPEEKVKEAAQKLVSKFVDFDFYCTLESLEGDRKIVDEKADKRRLRKLKKIEWKRISQLKQYNHLFDPDDIFTIHDISQGDLSNCFLISPISALTSHPSLVKRIFNTKSKNKKGMYSISLCHQGVFQEILIDDFIPVSKTGEPHFANSNSEACWPLLLEKAFAKKLGAYWHTGGGGNSSKVLKDLTGAPVYNHDLERYVEKYQNDHEKLYEKIHRLISEAIENKFIIVTQSKKGEDKVMVDLGIAQWHYYSVIGSFKLANGDYVIKMRNPWGNGCWKGQYSSSDRISMGSKELVGDEVFEKNVKNCEESKGVFCMPFDCYLSNFLEIDVCQCSEDAIYTQYKINSFEILRSKTQIFKIKVSSSGTYHLSFSQIDSRANQYDYCTLIILERSKDKKFKFLKVTGNKLRDITMKLNLTTSCSYYAYLHIPNTFFYRNQKQHYTSLNIYGPGESAILKISDIPKNDQLKILKKSLEEKAKENNEWFGFKKKEFQNVEYTLIHEMGIGAVVLKNDSSSEVRFSFTLTGNGIEKFTLDRKGIVIKDEQEVSKIRGYLDVKDGEIEVFLYEMNDKHAKAKFKTSVSYAVTSRGG